jgi:hypothetical protein
MSYVRVAYDEGRQLAVRPVDALLDSSSLLRNVAGRSDPALWCADGDGAAAMLRSRLREEGYVFVRGVLPRGPLDEAFTAAVAAADALRAPAPAVAVSGVNLAGHAVTASPVFERIFDGPELHSVVAACVGSPAVLRVPTVWLRAMGEGSWTDAHTDAYFFGGGGIGDCGAAGIVDEGSRSMYVAWTPLHAVPLAAGPLCVCIGSHKLPPYSLPSGAAAEGRGEDEGPGEAKRAGRAAPRDELPPAFTIAAATSAWAAADVVQGDVILFHIRLVHASLPNLAGLGYRVSADTRWYFAP